MLSIIWFIAETSYLAEYNKTIRSKAVHVFILFRIVRRAVSRLHFLCFELDLIDVIVELQDQKGNILIIFRNQNFTNMYAPLRQETKVSIHSSLLQHLFWQAKDSYDLHLLICTQIGSKMLQVSITVKFQQPNDSNVSVLKSFRPTEERLKASVKIR